jgi:hypothetical protein
MNQWALTAFIISYMGTTTLAVGQYTKEIVFNRQGDPIFASLMATTLILFLIGVIIEKGEKVI